MLHFQVSWRIPGRSTILGTNQAQQAAAEGNEDARDAATHAARLHDGQGMVAAARRDA